MNYQLSHTHIQYTYIIIFITKHIIIVRLFLCSISIHKKYVLHFRSRSGSQWINQPPSLEIKERPTRRFPAKYHQRIASSTQSTKVAVRGPKIAIRTSIGWWGRWIQIKIDSKSISENQWRAHAPICLDMFGHIFRFWHFPLAKNGEWGRISEHQLHHYPSSLVAMEHPSFRFI